MTELDRTNAWDRSVMMLISPTGTGYVNYCAVAAAQYTLGDIATVLSSTPSARHPCRSAGSGRPASRIACCCKC
jgi:hypothetical protein